MELAESVRNPVAAWRRYWFAPAPCFDLAMTRIVVVAYQLWHITRPGYRGQLVGRTALPDALYDPLPVLHLLLWPAGWAYRPDAVVLDVVLLATVAAGALALIGLLTNGALIAFALGCVFLQSFLWSFGDFHHPETVPVIALGLLALSPAGAVLSVDDFRRRLRGVTSGAGTLDFDLKHVESPYAGWALKLIGWFLVLVYASAAYSKLSTAGLEWFDGYTLRWYIARDGLRWNVPAGVWLSGHHATVVLLSWMTLVVEAGFVLVMLFPVTRWLFLPMGAGFHLGIYYFIRARFFGWVAAYSALVPWRDGLERAASRLGRPSQPVVVLFDGACSLCRRSMVLARYWDWLERVQVRRLQDERGEDRRLAGLDPDALRREMHVVAPDGEIRTGFFGFRRLLRELPPLWPVLPFFYLPGASRLGPAVYRRVAARRNRRLCDGDECAVHRGHAA